MDCKKTEVAAVEQVRKYTEQIWTVQTMEIRHAAGKSLYEKVLRKNALAGLSGLQRVKFEN
jgi:hypothetical protein